VGGRPKGLQAHLPKSDVKREPVQAEIIRCEGEGWVETVVAFETLVAEGGVDKDESDDDIEDEGDDEDMSTGVMGDAVGVETVMVCPAICVYSCIGSW
jgi:hypothetical protein